jgi:4-hydroxybenzoate polyprenyltransferase
VVSIPQAWAFTIASACLLVVASANLNRACLVLSPFALASVMGYSFTKRWTRWSHLLLGGAIGIAPVGAWIAVTGGLAWTPVMLAGAVALWIGGFDIVYSLQDVAVDRELGLHSLPARLGPMRALHIARLMHGGMLALLGAVGIAAGLGAWFYAAVVLCAAALGLEHAIVDPDDSRRIHTAFFTMNGWVGIGLFVVVLVDRWPH